MPATADAFDLRQQHFEVFVIMYRVDDSRIHYQQRAAERFALPALGRGRRSRPARKKLRRRKLLGMCAESPASGARFVGQFSLYTTLWRWSL